MAVTVPDIAKAVTASGAFVSHREATDIAKTIDREFKVTPRFEELLAVGGPRHGEKLRIEKGRPEVRVAEREREDGGPATYRPFTTVGVPSYREHRYERVTLVAQGTPIYILLHAG